MGDRDAVRKARRSAAVLKIAGFVGLLLGQIGDRRGARGEVAPVHRRDAFLLRCLDRHRGDFGREKQHRRIAAAELDDQLTDIAVAPAETGRQRQRHRPGASIDGAEKQRSEFGAGLGDQRDAVAGLHARGDQPIRGGQRVAFQFAIRIRADQLTTRIVEIEPAGAGRRIVERFADRGKIGKAARLGAEGRRRHELVRQRGKIVCHKWFTVPGSGRRGNKHVIFLCHGALRDP